MQNAPTRERSGLRSDARAAAEKLYRNGAILTFVGSPRTDVLLGDMRWADEDTVLFFVAYGEGPPDAWQLRFDSVVVEDDSSVSFSNEGRTMARLRRIEDADVVDPDDYRIAWQLWQQVVPLRRAVIERCYEALELGR